MSLADTRNTIAEVRAEDEPDACTAELWALYDEMAQELDKGPAADADLLGELLARAIEIGKARDAQSALRGWQQ